MNNLASVHQMLNECRAAVRDHLERFGVADLYGMALAHIREPERITQQAAANNSPILALMAGVMLLKEIEARMEVAELQEQSELNQPKSPANLRRC